jgi:hypothetical protein
MTTPRCLGSWWIRAMPPAPALLTVRVVDRKRRKEANVAVAMMVDNPQGSQEVYERIRAHLGFDKPAGGIFHIAGPSPNGGWRVMAVGPAPQARVLACPQRYEVGGTRREDESCCSRDRGHPRSRGSERGCGYGLSLKGGYWSVTRTKAYAVTRLPQRPTPTTNSNSPRGYRPVKRIANHAKITQRIAAIERKMSTM